MPFPRAAIVGQLTGPEASKSASRATVAQNETFQYTLAYQAGDVAHTLSITDIVPAATLVLGASGSKNPTPAVSGQWVTWQVPVGVGEAVTLTILARGATPGIANNTATFSGTHVLSASAPVLVYGSRIQLPLVLKSSAP